MDVIEGVRVSDGVRLRDGNCDCVDEGVIDIEDELDILAVTVDVWVLVRVTEGVEVCV